jgi:DNA-binding transcriptional MerR regulator
VGGFLNYSRRKFADFLTFAIITLIVLNGIIMEQADRKNRKIYYSMGEVAEMFDVNQSLIRFWEKEFDILKPHKNSKGNRMFTADDIENLKLIYHLVKEQGMTLSGAQKRIKENREGVNRDMEILDRLLKIKALLSEIRADIQPAGIAIDVAADDDEEQPDEYAEYESATATPDTTEEAEQVVDEEPYMPQETATDNERQTYEPEFMFGEDLLPEEESEPWHTDSESFDEEAAESAEEEAAPRFYEPTLF